MLHPCQAEVEWQNIDTEFSCLLEITVYIKYINVVDSDITSMDSIQE